MLNVEPQVTLRLMTASDLPLLHDWLGRAHVAEWWDGQEAHCSLQEIAELYLPSTLAKESVTPYIAIFQGQEVGYAQSYIALGSGEGWWEDETDPGVRGIDQFLANPNQLNQGVGTWLVRALVDHLFADPIVTKIQIDPAPSNHRAIRCYEKAGFLRKGLVTTPDGQAVYMVQTRQAYEMAQASPPAAFRGLLAPKTLC